MTVFAPFHHPARGRDGAPAARRFAASIGAMGLLVVLLAGCGGSSDGATADTTTTTEPEKVCSPMDHGAKGDGTTLDTEALQATIDDCAGGVVEVPSGTYSTGSLVLPSGSTLRLADDAVLRGTTDLADWTEKALIWVSEADDVVIEGGTIEGNGPHWWEEFKAGRRRAGNVVQIADSTNVTVRDVTLRESPSWTLKIIRTDGVLVDGVTIRNPVVAWPEAANTDGIDIVSSSNIEIADCDIETADDAIALKTEEGMGPVEGVEVHGCTLAGWAHGFHIGLETWDDVRDVVFRDSVIRASQESNPGTTYFAAISLVSMYGADIEGVTIEGITIEDTQVPLFLRVQGGGGYPDGVEVEPGSMTDVVIRDVTVANATKTSAILGDPRSPIGSLTLEGIDIVSTEVGTAEDAARPFDYAALDLYASPRLLPALPAHGIYFAFVDGPVTIEDVNVTRAEGDERPLLVLEDADAVDPSSFGDDVEAVTR